VTGMDPKSAKGLTVQYLVAAAVFCVLDLWPKSEVGGIRVLEEK